MKFYKNMLKIAVIVIETVFYHMNMNIPVSHAYSMYLKEKRSFRKYAEQKKFCICIDVNKIYDGYNYDEIYKVLSTLKNQRLKINNILIEKYKDMLENSDVEQNYWSRTAQGVYKIGHDSIRIMKWICYYDRSYYENINYYDLMGSVCRYNIDIT